MHPYVVGEWNYGILDDPFYLENKKKRQEYNNKIKEQRIKYGKKVKCINDDKEFLSIGEASKYYNININSVRRSVNEKRPVMIRKYKIEYQFVAI